MKLGRHYLQHFMVTSLENTVVENVNIEVTEIDFWIRACNDGHTTFSQLA